MGNLNFPIWTEDMNRMKVPYGPDLHPTTAGAGRGVYRCGTQTYIQLGLFQKLSLGRCTTNTFFVLWVEHRGCFVDNVSEGWGVGR